MTVIATYAALLIASCAACGAILHEQPVEITIRAIDDARPPFHRRRPPSNPAAAAQPLQRRSPLAARNLPGDDVARLAARRHAFGVVPE